MRRRQGGAASIALVLSLAVIGVIQALNTPGGAAQLRIQPRAKFGSVTAVVPLQAPRTLRPFHRSPQQGHWREVGRLADNHSAVYETTLQLPDNPAVSAGIAWMDTKLLKARLYSGSLSPGGLFWKYTAPISRTGSRTLVASFNGGFLLKDSGGGYLSEGHLVAPLRAGAASLVIYKSGFATVGEWGRDVSMTSSVVAVRQNLTLLVDNGKPAPGLNPADISVWGTSLHNLPNTWRSGLGVTTDGALVYVVGPMNIVDLANILVRAGAIRAMTLDMNPNWPIFATYDPATNNGTASPANGTDLLPTMIQTPARFFTPAYSRDFITMSAP